MMGQGQMAKPQAWHLKTQNTDTEADESQK